MSPRAYVLAATFAAGIVLADRLSPGFPESLWTGAAGAVLISLAFLRHRAHGEPAPAQLLPRLGASWVGLVIIGVGAVGFAAMGMRSAALERSLSPTLDGRYVTVEGRALSDPQELGRGSSFRIVALSIDGRDTHERLRVRTYGETKSIALGDRLRLLGKVRALDPHDPFDRYLMRRRVVGEVIAAELRVVSSTLSPVMRAANTLRSRMDLLAASSSDRGAAGLVLGLTIGDERLISDEVTEDFRTTSLSHLTAVSGANVAMVLGAVILLLRVMGVSRRAQIAWGIAAVVFFGVVTRWEPSVLRACVMAVVAMAAYFFGRRHDALGGIALAFAGLLAFDPFLLWSVGFQLSFAATLGILLITPRLLERMKRWPRGVAEAFAVGLAAQAAVTPLLAFHFERISPSAIPANLAAFPLVAPITVLGLVGGVLGLAVPALGRLPFEGAVIIAKALRAVASFFAGMPFSSIAVEDFGIPALVASWLLVLAWAAWLSGRRMPARISSAAALATIALFSIVPPATSAPPTTGLRMTFFDVGQGDSALIESPGGARVLIDGGPDLDLVAEALRKRRIGRLDLLVVTHPHADHITGLAAVHRGTDVREALGPGVENPLVGRLGLEGVFEGVGAGERILVGDLGIDVLAPDPHFVAAAVSETEGAEDEGGGTALNDVSVVLRVAWGEECALFTGDIEEAAQDFLLSRYLGAQSAIECTVLKAPHHGSARVVAAFIDAVDPEWIVVSVGRNAFGHPTPRALTIYEDAGAEVLRTDHLGDVVLVMDPAGRVAAPGGG